MAHKFNWSLGHEGKGNVYDDGSIETWNYNPSSGKPHHLEQAIHNGNQRTQFHFYISPEGGLNDGGLTFNNHSPLTDDQHVKQIAEQHPGVYDARHEFDEYGEPGEERVETPGGYGHAYNLLEMMSRIGQADKSNWAKFHTEFKLPRGVRKKIRRWVDRLKWPEGSSQDDSRRYHITVLSMDEYDADFEKWARGQVQGQTFHFESMGMQIFGGEHVVLRFECPEWTELVLNWQRKAEEDGLEPRTFDPPKAHITIGKSPDGKWPQGVPDPHVKFDTRMFNINKNSMAADPNWINQWIQKNGPYLYHGAKSRSGVDPEQVAQSIEQQGIIPQGDNRAQEDYPGYEHWDDGRGEANTLLNWWQTPRAGHTYLTRNPREAYGEPTFRVDLRKLDPSKLKADEDLMEDEGKWLHFGPLSNPATEGEPRTLGEQAEEVGWGDDPEDTHRSLEGRGTIAHEGVIPPEAIERIDNVKPKQSAETTPAQDLKSWLDSFTVEQPTPALSPHHTDADQFQPQVVAPVVQTPHVDPPSKPYKPYDWAEEGYEESPLDRTGAVDTHICPECGEDIEGQICSVCKYDPQAKPDAFEDAERHWYDMAWKDNYKNKARPDQPMHWGPSDHATDVSLASTARQGSIDTAHSGSENDLQGDPSPPSGGDQANTLDVEPSTKSSRKDSDDLDNAGQWHSSSEYDITSEPTDDLRPVWAREPNRGAPNPKEQPSPLSGVRAQLPSPTASVSRWHEI